jgi:hypothetical protein
MTSLLTVFVPAGMEGTTFEHQSKHNGVMVTNKYQARPWNGHWVIDVPLAFFNHLTGSAGHKGLVWSECNPEVTEWLSQGDRRIMVGNAFPGEHRAPPVAAVKVDAAPRMVRMIAPEGCTSFSHGGVEYKISGDRLVTIEAHVAETLRSHGFLDAA